MPTIGVNKDLWDGQYNWTHHGDEWSYPWGGPEAQWFSVILPRVRAFLPAATVLEIAPGYGRWTQFLAGHCARLELVDLSEECILACRSRFAERDSVGYHVNDGLDLSMIPDGSIDFAFSFDSLVHAELDVLDSYAGQLATKLAPNGVAFFHHSALGIHREVLEAVEGLPGNLRADLVQPRWLMANHLRARSVTAAAFEHVCHKNGLRCISQELVNWREDVLTDCFSTFTVAGSAWDRPNRVIENHDFMRDADLIRRLAWAYSYPPSSPVVPAQRSAQGPGEDLGE